MQMIRMVEGAAVAPYSLDEETKVLTVAGIEIDLAAAEADCQTILNVTNDGGTPVLGLSGKNGYIADVEIPPRRYDTVEEEGDDGEPLTKTIPRALDTKSVVLKLWPFPVESSSNNQQKEAV